MKKQAGFTLIEALIYLALFAIIIGGVMVSVYGIIQSSNKNQTKIVLQEEGDFLLSKINWALIGASAINSPAVGATSTTLSLNKYNSASTPALLFDLSASKLRLKEGTGALATSTPLNSDNVQVQNLIFATNQTSGAPTSVMASFTLQALTSNGTSVTQDFSTTKYLRK